tara:strand:+ start:228 stop:1283 length:1056 start_codon:yes stop_codon:yes gene_type:complete
LEEKYNCRALYYAPVDPKYFKKWEYYRVDKQMLEDVFTEVVVSNKLSICIYQIFFNRPQMVYIWWWHRSFIVILLCKILRLPTIGTGAVHMFDESGSKDFFSHSFIYRLLNRLAWRFLNVTLFISKSQYRQVVSHEKVRNPKVLKSSILSDHLSPPNFKRTSKKIKLLTVCWLTEDQIKRKSLYILLDAISKLFKDQRSLIHLTIIGGNGNGLSALEAYVGKLGLKDQVEIIVDADESEKIMAYKQADLYFQASFYEGFGNSVMEAMSYGLPALVSGYTAQPEVVGNSGLVLRQIDCPSIQEQLVYFLSLSVKERNAMRRKAYETVIEQHSYEVRFREFKKIIRDLNLEIN